MFFSRKPTSFVLVERDRLHLYPKSKAGPLELSEDVVQYLEVKDSAKFSAAVQEFAEQNKLRGQRLLLMLDKSIVFQKAVPMAGTDAAAAKADFESKVPFNPEDRQVISLEHKDHHFMFGVNQAFYQSLADAFTKAGAKVQAVAPAIVFGVTDSSKLTHTKLAQIADATSLTHLADFMGSV
jgi:hypothetical protein